MPALHVKYFLWVLQAGLNDILRGSRRYREEGDQRRRLNFRRPGPNLKGDLKGQFRVC